MRFVARRRGYYGWRLVTALGVISIIGYGTILYFFGVLVVPVEQELGWHRAELSLSYSVAIVVSGLLGYPVGHWVDRKGARAIMACGSILAGLSLIGLSRVHQLWEWNVLWGGGLGVAGAMTLYPVAFTVVANWFHRQRGQAMALLTVLGGLASPIYIPLAGWLVPRVGWRETLILFGLTQLGIAFPLALLAVRRHPEDAGLFPDGAPSAEVAPTTPLSGIVLRSAMRQLPFWTLTFTNGVGVLGTTMLFAHQVAYMIGRGQDPAVAAMLAGFLGLASLPGRYVFNAMSDRVHSQLLLGVCQTMLALGVGLLTLASSTTGLIAYIVVFGSSFGAGAALTASVRAEHFGRRAFGAITAVQGIPSLAGAAMGPLGAGWIYDRSGSYQLAFTISAALYLLSAVGMFLTPKPPFTHRSLS